MMTNRRETTTCRSCHSDHLTNVLELGDFAVSGFLLEATYQDIERGPLTLCLCEECDLVQLRYSLPPEVLYKHYWYKSGVQEAMVKSLREVVDDGLRRVQMKPEDYVLDIGCNDGTLLNLYPPEVKLVVGFEPAKNMFESAYQNIRHRRVLLYNKFFPIPDQPDIGLGAKIITSIAMFYDLDDPHPFVGAIKRILHPEGVWIVQMNSLEGMLISNAYDNICHEHLCYYSSAAFRRLVNTYGLAVVHEEQNLVNGGSTRFIVQHTDAFVGESEVPTIPYIVRSLAIISLHAKMMVFKSRVEQCREHLISLVKGLKADGKTIWAYGASTKGNTTLQYCNLGPDRIDAIAERNPDKWGLVTPTGIPILPEQAMREAQPDYLLILPWHFLESFKEREACYLEKGGKFIVPLPEVQIIEHSLMTV